MKKQFTRILAVVLSVLLLVCNISTVTLAADDESANSVSLPVEETVGEDSAGDGTKDTAAQEIAETELSPFAGSSVSGNEGQAQKAENVLEETENEEEGMQEETAFLPLSIDTMSTAFSGKPGDVVDFFVTLNREDVAVSYQWQRLYCGKTYDGEGQAIYDYEGGESTSYIFPLEGMTEAELLEMNPDATWQGIEMYYDQLKKADGDATKVAIAPNTPNYILESEAAAAVNVRRLDRLPAQLQHQRRNPRL